jgi:rhodanese-related sulfurtransferase
MNPVRGAVLALAVAIAAPAALAGPVTPADGGQKSPAVPVTLQQMLTTAHAAVPRITPAQAREMMSQGNTIVLDVREAREIEQSGKIAGALNVSRGMLEFFADKNLPKDKTLIVYCASGARAALAGKTLKDMGYAHVYNLGGFRDWVSSGGAVER